MISGTFQCSVNELSFLSLQTMCILLPLQQHFFVWLTHLMKNVIHDCPLNPLICGPDPINHDTASSNKFPAFYQVYFGSYNEWWGGSFFLFVCQLFPPSYELFQWMLLQSWMGFVRFGRERLQGGFTFPHFCLAGLSQLGLIIHIQQTLICFSTLSQTKQSARETRK